MEWRYCETIGQIDVESSRESNGVNSFSFISDVLVFSLLSKNTLFTNPLRIYTYILAGWWGALSKSDCRTWYKQSTEFFLRR